MITFEDFSKLDIRIGKIIEIEDFPEANKPAYKLTIDFGHEIGLKKSAARLVKNYTKEELKDKRVCCLVNLPPRQIGPFVSEVLVLGAPDHNNECVLVSPDDKAAIIGSKLY